MAPFNARPELLSLELWSQPPRQLLGLHSGMLVEYSQGGGAQAYTLHGLAPNGTALLPIGKGRLGGPIGGDARVCAHDERLACVRDLRCGWCHAAARCVLAPMAQASASSEQALRATGRDWLQRGRWLARPVSRLAPATGRGAIVSYTVRSARATGVAPRSGHRGGWPILLTTRRHAALA